MSDSGQHILVELFCNLVSWLRNLKNVVKEPKYMLNVFLTPNIGSWGWGKEAAFIKSVLCSRH
jgi:hypothetical protein